MRLREIMRMMKENGRGRDRGEGEIRKVRVSTRERRRG